MPKLQGMTDESSAQATISKYQQGDVTINVRPDAAKVAQALRELARTLDDPYLMPDDLLKRLLDESNQTTAAIVAEDGDRKPVGVVLYSLFVSTMRGKVGAFVTDLWVAKEQRGKGIGRKLLARTRDEVATRWHGTFLRLNYYKDNAEATAFYNRLGFHSKPHEIWVTLEGQELEALSNSDT